MKKNLLRVLYALTVGVSLAGYAAAQNDREKEIVSAAGDVYVISAKAGGVSVVEGDAAVARENGKSGKLLRRDGLSIGDKVTTGQDGKVEILLNPGSYLRLGGNSEFEFLTTNLEDLRLRVNRGSAILEVFASNEFQVQINTPNNKFFFIESGIYRVDVSGANETVSVWKGLARVGQYDSKTVKKGRRATVLNGKVSTNKFNRNQLDELGRWSEARAELIAKANEKLELDALKASLLASYRSSGWDFYGSFGLWVYNPYVGTYVFLPFGSRWRTPYGYAFGYDVWSYGSGYPWHSGGWGHPPIINPPIVNPPVVVPPTGNPPPSAANLERAERLRTPPFQRMPESSRREESSSGSSTSSSDSGNNSGSDRSSRTESPSSDTKTYSPPPSSDTKTYSPPPPSDPPPVFNPPQSSDTKGKP